MMPKMQEF